jgi:5-methylcytosine-specific restriction protein A
VRQVDKQIISVLSRGSNDREMIGAIGRSGERFRHLKTLSAKVTTLDTRTVKPQPKQTDPHYLSPEHRAWRQTVCDRAGWRCEWIDERGQRCAKAAPQHRMFADHKKERQDAADAELDPANGWCLCGAHHSRKTAQEREKRLLRG